MTVLATSSPTHRPLGSQSRDRSIDLVRAALLVVVVVLHSLMVGVSWGTDGPLLENATESQAWFTPVTWFAQIMPLFFLIGGFSSITHWRKVQSRDGSASDYVRTRLVRLLVPGLALVAIIGVGIIGMTVAGVSAEIIATAGYRISQPLWFLGVYVLCSALVPLAVMFHGKHPVVTLASLGAAALTVDAIRFSTGIEVIGYVNLLVVWLFIQQLGFWLADGLFGKLSRRFLGFTALNSLLLLVLLTAAGPYSADMLQNLNPPTVALVLLGVSQLCGFILLRGYLIRLAEFPPINKIVDALGSRSMTIYLWHMPVLIALASILLVSGADLPTPTSEAWWATRPRWLLAVGVTMVPVAYYAGRIETVRLGFASGPTSARTAFLATILGASGVLTILVTNFSIPGAAIAVVLLSGSIAVVARRGIRQARSSPQFAKK